MLHDRVLEVNCNAIRHNIALLRGTVPPSCRLLAMVKANGYGTDIVGLGRAIADSGVDILGVAHFDEAVALREGGVEQDILVLHAWPEQAQEIAEYGVEIGVSNGEMIQALASANLDIPVHLQVNTGINRFGCRPLEAVTLAERIASEPALKFRGIMSHFAAADTPEEDLFTQGQEAQFRSLLEVLHERQIVPTYRHIQNSPSMVRFNFNGYNMARAGIMILGVHPSAATQEKLALTPAIALKARIIKIDNCKRGDTISYGRSYRVEREEERIALIPIGYGDGVHRIASGKGYARLHGKNASFCGNICMDFMMLNVTDIPEAKVGDSVTLFGDEEGALSIEEFAQQAETIPHEIITSFGHRIHRQFISM